MPDRAASRLQVLAATNRWPRHMAKSNDVTADLAKLLDDADWYYARLI